MRTHRFIRTSTIVTGAALAAAAAGGASADSGYTAELFVQIGGGAPMFFEIDGIVSNSPEAGVAFIGLIESPDGDWQIAYDLSAAVNDNGNDVISGALTVDNMSGETLPFYTSLSVPMCPLSSETSLIGGLVSIALQTDADGGSLSSSGSPSVWSASLDGQEVQGLFWAPYSLATSGAGSMQTYNIFGNPFPGMPSQGMAEDVALNYDFLLTAGDHAVINTTFVVGMDPDAPPAPQAQSGCGADINADGFVDYLDLAEVITNWGAEGGCLSQDTNGDELVNNMDINEVLANWGPCAAAAQYNGGGAPGRRR